MNKAKYIDPMIGTVGEASEGHGGGKTYPGACLSGGMVQLSPDTVSGGDNVVQDTTTVITQSRFSVLII